MGPTHKDKSNKLGAVLEGTHDQERCLRTGLNQECVFLRTLCYILKIWGHFAIGKNSKPFKTHCLALHSAKVSSFYKAC